MSPLRVRAGLRSRSPPLSGAGASGLVCGSSNDLLLARRPSAPARGRLRAPRSPAWRGRAPSRARSGSGGAARAPRTPAGTRPRRGARRGDSSTSRSTPWPCAVRFTRSSCSSTMSRICSRPSAWKTMISSMRLRNSGRKWPRSTSISSRRSLRLVVLVGCRGRAGGAG